MITRWGIGAASRTQALRWRSATPASPSAIRMAAAGSGMDLNTMFAVLDVVEANVPSDLPSTPLKTKIESEGSLT